MSIPHLPSQHPVHALTPPPTSLQPLQVRAYRELRTDDAAPGSASSYRITVRQLEALVRLSEALSRAHCSAGVKPEHVMEVGVGCWRG